MSAPESILQKIKLLLKLTASPNPNEAENAKSMADKLIAKHNVSEEELKSLEDKQPLYGENERVFSTTGLEGWRQQIVLAVAKHFGCQIVQEETVPSEGPHEFSYFAYGPPEDVVNVKIAYAHFAAKVEQLFLTNCAGRGPIYIASYGEGVAESLRHNIMMDGIDLPSIKKPVIKTEEKQTETSAANLAKPKEKPAQESVNVNSQSFIKDIRAYFKGLEDGRDLSISDLELENNDETAGRLQETTEET